MRLLARLARVVLIAALLAGWQAALVHPLGHLERDGGFVHLAGGPAKGGNPAGLASVCDALAALSACAPPALAAFTAQSARSEAPSHRSGAPRLAGAPPFLAQGPPELL